MGIKKTKSSFTRRLRNLRLYHGFTQVEASEHVKVAYTTYRYYESGRFKPPAETLRQIAIAFNTTTDYLLGLTNDFEVNPKIRKSAIGEKRYLEVKAKIKAANERSRNDPDTRRKLIEEMGQPFDDEE